MALSPLVTLLIANLLLLAAGLIVFLPRQPLPWRGKEAQRLLDKYGKFLLAAGAVLVVHLLLVQVDDEVTRAIGWDFADAIAQYEGGAVPALQALWTPALNVLFSVIYLLIHPWMLYFPVLLFILSDEERPAKATLLIFPLAYLLALPFYLLLPVTNVFTYYGVQSPIFELFPALVDVYYSATSVNNTFPSLHVAFGLLIANAARYSRNRTYRYWAYFYGVSVVLSTLYLNIHWITDVVGGVAIALVVGVFTSRFISTERLALQRVKPTPEEAQGVSVAAERLVKRVQAELAYRAVDAEAMLVGSVAKDTYLRNNVDLDVFILFPTSVPREELARLGLEIGRAVLDETEEKYAEHPYVHGRWEGYPSDVVPCYAVASAAERKTAVDRTPFHTRFVLERMERDQRDQVRLLKAFMKGVGVYGAESKTHGFSGYLCELLILKYGTFRRTLAAGTGWKPGTFLVLESIEGNPKFTEPLVFLDPVDVRRNVASAVSAETLHHFAESCRAYLRREGLSFFFPRQLVPHAPDELAQTLRRRRGDFVILRTRAPDVLAEHLHDQMRKLADAATRLLERYGFEVRRISYELGADVIMLIELPHLRLPETVTHVGPPVKSREHAERFRKAWSSHPDARSPVYEEEGRLKVERLREYRRADQVLREKLLELDCGKHLNDSLRQGYDVSTGLDIVQEDTTRLLTRHFNRKKSWEI